MRKIFVLVVVIGIYTACTKNNTATPGLTGSWKEYEVYFSPGDATTWKAVKYGNILIIKSNSTYITLNAAGKKINSGTYNANDSIIIFKPDSFTTLAPLINTQASYSIENSVLEMWYYGCIEGCGTRFKKIL